MVAKEAHVTGEVVIRKDAIERTETVYDTVRRTDLIRPSPRPLPCQAALKTRTSPRRSRPGYAP